MTNIQVRHWADHYRGSALSIRSELQARIRESYNDAMGRRLKSHSSCVYPQAITLENGLYWCDGTIYLPPGVSLIGQSRGTCIQFETDRDDYRNKGDQFFRIDHGKAYLKSTHTKAVCIAGIGTVDGAGFPHGHHTSHERCIAHMTLHCRGDASGVVLFGRETNPRIHDLHLHGYGGDKDACAIAICYPTATPNAIELSKYQARESNGWATNLFVGDNFIEGFGVGVMISGADGTCRGNQFWQVQNPYHVRNSQHISFSGPGVFTRCSGHIYHIVEYPNLKPWDGPLPNWRNDAVESASGARDRYIFVDRSGETQDLKFKWGEEVPGL